MKYEYSNCFPKKTNKNDSYNIYDLLMSYININKLL